MFKKRCVDYLKFRVGLKNLGSFFFVHYHNENPFCLNKKNSKTNDLSPTFSE